MQEHHVLPSLCLLLGFVGYFASQYFAIQIADCTETPCERWYDSYKERRIEAMEEQDDGEKSACAMATLCLLRGSVSFSVLFAIRYDEEEANEVLDFSVAAHLPEGAKGAFLKGSVKSYAIQHHPLYADAFEHLLPQNNERQASPHDDSGRHDAGEASSKQSDNSSAGPTKPVRPMSASQSRLKPKLEPLSDTPPAPQP